MEVHNDGDKAVVETSKLNVVYSVEVTVVALEKHDRGKNAATVGSATINDSAPCSSIKEKSFVDSNSTALESFVAHGVRAERRKTGMLLSVEPCKRPTDLHKSPNQKVKETRTSVIETCNFKMKYADKTSLSEPAKATNEENPSRAKVAEVESESTVSVADVVVKVTTGGG